MASAMIPDDTPQPVTAPYPFLAHQPISLPQTPTELVDKLRSAITDVDPHSEAVVYDRSQRQ